MALTLVNNPVTINGSTTNNLFAGFEDVEFTFKREDLQIVSIGAGIDSKLLITVGLDLTAILSTGDEIYLFAPSSVANSNFKYDGVYTIETINATEILCEELFIEASESGYINYLPNYFVEAELVNVDNSDIKVIPFRLKDDGDLAGNININVSIANDLNELEFVSNSSELTDARIKFKMQYRQVYDGSSESFTLISDEIILYFGTEQPEQIETLISAFDEPKIYKGYDSGIIYLHSDSNTPEPLLFIRYEQLDLNKDTLVGVQDLKQYDTGTEYGQLLSILPGSTILNANTKYIRFSSQFGRIPFFDPNFFSNFFEIT